MNADCPASDWLERFENGQLSDGASQPIERHVVACATCAMRLRELRRRDADAQLARDLFRRTGSTRILATSDGIAEEARREADAANQPQRANEQVHSAEGVDNVGWSIPDYERIQLCGEGAYGSVWAVRDRVGVYRALKLIDLERLGRTAAVRRERTALETYCRTIHRHPYLVTVFHVGMVDHLLYYTMELADDCNSTGMVRDRFPPNYRPLTLETLVRRGRLHVDVAMELARRLLRGLSKLHGLDLVHRDVKPSNVIFVNRQPKLADIGMVSTEIEAGVRIGTPEYMPPDRVMNKTADTYAFGKVLHQMIAGRNATSFPSLPPERMRASMKWDMARLNELIVRACAPNADDRYPNAAAMLEDLDACADLQLEGILEESRDPAFAFRPAAQREFVQEPVAASERPAMSSREYAKRSEAAEIAKAFARTIPWILGFVAVMFAMSYVARIFLP